MTVTSDIDKLRVEIGDLNVDPDTDALYQDDQLQYFLDTYGAILPAAAAACDALARRFARQFDFAEDGQSFSLGQRSKQYAQLATELRRRAASGITTEPTTRTDGYSDDVNYQESEQSSRTGRVRIGYTDPDLPI